MSGRTDGGEPPPDGAGIRRYRPGGPDCYDASGEVPPCAASGLLQEWEAVDGSSPRGLSNTLATRTF